MQFRRTKPKPAKKQAAMITCERCGHRQPFASMAKQRQADGGGGGGQPVVQITGPVYIRDEQDIEELAYRITRMQERKGRGLG